ncbi:MAG: hypothetical protein KY475_03835 [Planctomycetes bacterium]|nr:hypothetical protein [Planctomycetota bacterium]
MLEGSGGIALVKSHARGVVGTMPGADLIEAIVPLWRALQTGDERTVNRISPPLSALVSLQTGLDGFLAVEKYLLAKQRVFENTVIRGPVGYVLDEDTRREVDRLWELLREAGGNAECGVRNAEFGMKRFFTFYSAFRISHSAFVCYASRGYWNLRHGG